MEISPQEKGVAFRFRYDPERVAIMKEVGARWHPEEKAWFLHPLFLARLGRLLEKRELWQAYASMIRRGVGAFREVSSLLLPEQREDLRRLWMAFFRWARNPLAPKGYLLALGTGTGKTFVYSAFLRILEAMGLEGLLVVPNEDLIRQTGEVMARFGLRARVTTYGKLDPAEAAGKVLVLDEAHLAKAGWGSERGRRSWKASLEAFFVLYASATPFDRPWEALYLLKPTRTIPHGESDERFLARFGVRTREYSNGGKEFYFAGKVEDLIAFHETLKARGFTHKRFFVPPDGLVEHEVLHLDLPREERELLGEVRRRLKELSREVDPSLRGLIGAQRTILSRGLLERFKLKAVFPAIEELLAEGWHVALFLQYRGERELDLTTEEGLASLLEEADARGVSIARYLLPALRGLHLRFPSPLDLVEERFGFLGEGLAFYTGREGEGALKRAKREWDEGKVRLLVLTGAKGGTGLSLHDTRGGRPTAQVVLTLPWTASQLDQVLGRTVRVGLASRVRILFPVARVPAERRLGEILAASLHTLGYAVRGGIPVVPPKVVKAFLYDLASTAPDVFGQILEGEEDLLP
ncbi:MAG: DEAD/DEAH box helicase family protein [Thermus sp.]